MEKERNRDRDREKDRDRERERERYRGRARDRDTDRDRDRDRERDRERERERERDRERDRDRDRDRDHRRSSRRSPSYSPRRRRRSASRSRSRSRSPHSRQKPGRVSDDKSRVSESLPPKGLKDSQRAAIVTEAVDGAAKGQEENAGIPEPDEEEILMKKLGIPVGFSSTKGCFVADADQSAVKLNSKRQPRQYMNRRGGFNRPLPAEKSR